MGRFWWLVLVAACGSKPSKLEGDIGLHVGDCAPPTTAFVSGPKPQPFDRENPGDGRSVFLPPPLSAGGAGWGTIGTGRYGTIGHGSDAGVGGDRRSASVPTVSIGQPNAQGDLDKAIIRRYIKRNIQKIQYCYEKELLVKPKLAGTVSTQFFIKPDGYVATASAAGVDPNVADCVANVIKAIQFPKPKGGGGVQVNYPFIFRPAGAAPSKTARDDPPPPEAEDESGGTGTAMALEEGKMGKRDADRAEGQYKMQKVEEDAQLARQQAIEQARAAGILGKPGEPRGELRDYKPGLMSPFAFVRDELVDCFRLQKKRHGIAVIDIVSGKLEVHGIEDNSFKSCVTKLKIEPTENMRCSLAFGPMPLDEAPAIDITESKITMAGVPLDDAAVLHAHVEKGVKAVVNQRAPVALLGPLLIRAQPTTPMKLVTRVFMTAQAAGSDPVLAFQRDGKWTLFYTIPLPVEPVPFGTGSMWGPSKRVGAESGFDDESVQLVVLVAKDAIWVGISRVNEMVKIEGQDFAKLETVLRENKQSAFFSDRSDIEIAGEDDVTYEAVIKAIDTAIKNGFIDYTFGSPESMSVRFAQ